MLIELIMFGGIVFWILIFVFSLLAIAILEHEEGYGFLAATSIVLIVCLFLFTNLSTYFIAHPVLTTFKLLAGYVVGALLWATPKWLIKLWDLRRKYKRFRNSFLRDNGVSGNKITPELSQVFHNKLKYRKEFTKYGMSYDVDEMKVISPQLSECVDAIIGWMVWWPWDILWTVFRHPMKWICESFIELVETTYQKVSDYFFSGFNDEEQKDE